MTTAVTNTLRDGCSSTLDVANLVATKMDPMDKGSKLVKTLLSAYEEIGKHYALLIPESFVNLKAAITQFNNYNSLLGPFFRLGEYLQDGWKSENPNNWWVDTGNGYKGKAMLAASQAVEAVRILQSNFVLPVTQHLFTAVGKFPVFQAASKFINTAPLGSTVSSVAMKLTGLETIKNVLMLASAYYGIKKNNADIEKAHSRAVKGPVGLAKWETRVDDWAGFTEASKPHLISRVFDKKFKFIDDLRSAKARLESNKAHLERVTDKPALIQLRSDIKMLEELVANLESKQARFIEKYKNFGAGDGFRGTLTTDDKGVITENSANLLKKYLATELPKNNILGQQIDRLRSKALLAPLDESKAKRGLWKEYSKATVISFVTGIPFGILASPFVVGAFTTVLFVTGLFAFWCIRKDNADDAKRKDLVENLMLRETTLFDILGRPNNKVAALQPVLVGKDSASMIHLTSSDEDEE